MSLTILGIGTAVPEGHVTPHEGLGVARFIGGPASRSSGMLSAVYENSGNHTRNLIHGRQVIQDILTGTRLSESLFLPNGDPEYRGPTTAQRNQLYAELAPPLAVVAAKRALTESHVHPHDVTHLITVSCTGFSAPGVEQKLISQLCLSRTIERTHIGFMGCHGALNGLRVANAFATADPNAVVLLSAVELCSLHYHFGDDPEKVVANALFADGSAALVGVGSRQSLRNTSGPLSHISQDWSVHASGSCLIPESAAEMTWTISDHGFAMTLTKKVPKLIRQYVRTWLEDWLRAHEFTLEAIKSWAIHPGGPKILSATAEALGLDSQFIEPSRAIFANYGNMSSPTLLFILRELRQARSPRPCVMLGFGPGLTAEAILIL